MKRKSVADFFAAAFRGIALKEIKKKFFSSASGNLNLHVHFIFQHYEVAPYAAGIIDVDMDA